MKKSKVCYMYTVKDKILLLPTLANQFLMVDVKNNRMCSMLKNNKGESFIGACVLNQNQIICPSQNGEELVIVSFDEEKAERETLFFEMEMKEVCSDTRIFERELNFERTIKTIDSKSNVWQKKSNHNTGMKIYKELV